MAKQNGTMPKIDEDFMRELISQGVPVKQDNDRTDDVPQETLAETAQAEKPTPRKRRNNPGDYRETYFRKVELTDRQPLYVSRTTHEKLMRIAHRDGDRRAQGNGQQLCGKYPAAPLRAVPRRDKHPV